MIASLALQQRLGRRQPHLLDVLVDRAVLVDEGVRRGDVGLGLVVVVVADEVLDRVVREEGLELAVQLRRQGLVGRHHQGRLLHVLDDVGDGVGLARAGHAQQRLLRQAVLEAGGQPRDRLRLVARRREGRNQPEAVLADGSIVHRHHHDCGPPSLAAAGEPPPARAPPVSFRRLHGAPSPACAVPPPPLAGEGWGGGARRRRAAGNFSYPTKRSHPIPAQYAWPDHGDLPSRSRPCVPFPCPPPTRHPTTCRPRRNAPTASPSSKP
jgi:hypothetical protein